MKNLKNLIAGHAYWSDKKKELAQKGSIELSKCLKTKVKAVPISAQDEIEFLPIGTLSYSIGKNCIELAIDKLNQDRVENLYQGFSFYEAWGEIGPCEHCIKVRELKKERTKASRRLGNIRAAMTRIGRNIEYKDNKK